MTKIQQKNDTMTQKPLKRLILGTSVTFACVADKMTHGMEIISIISSFTKSNG